MVRLWYGGSSSVLVEKGDDEDIYALDPSPPNSPIISDLFGTEVLLPLASPPFDVYTDAEMTALTTSLLDEASAAITVVTPGNVMTNLATPGTFEATLESWAAGGSVPPTVTRDNTRAHRGTWSMKIVWGTGGSFPQSAKTISGLTVGVRYHIFAFAWVTPGDPAVKFVVGSLPGAGLDTTVEGEWQLFRYSFVATATSHSLQIWPAVAPTAGDTVWIDDIIVQASPAFETRATIPRFQGPDGHEGPLWLSIDGVTGYRLEPESGPIYARVTAAEPDIVTAQTDITDAETDLGALDVRIDSLESIPAPAFIRYATPGSFTWTKPTGAQRVLVQCLGAGGAGGGAATTIAGQASEGGGGAGGGYTERWFDAADLPATVDVFVGTGGTGSAGGAGTSGEDSRFGAVSPNRYLFATGGGGGSAGSASSGSGVFAAGGQGLDGGADLLSQVTFPLDMSRGGDGGPGAIFAAASLRMNNGGSSRSSGEASTTQSSASVSGGTGSRGGGGGGARNGASQSARAGGNGGSGLVLVTTFF